MKLHKGKMMGTCVVLLWIVGIGGSWAQEDIPEEGPTGPALATPVKTETAGTATATAETVATETVAPAEETISEISEPQLGGVFPSLSHKGDIADFLKLLGAASKKNIIPSPKVRGQVVVNLYDVTFKEALEAVLSVNGFAYEEKGPFIFVYTEEEFSQLQAAARILETRAYKLNYIPAKEVSELIMPLLSEDGEVTTSPEAGKPESETGENWAVANYIVVRDYPEMLEQIAKLVRELDCRPPQVLVEATILVASLEDKNELGIDLAFFGGINSDFISDDADLVVGNPQTDTGFETDFAANIDGGIKIGITSNNVGVIIRALESITDVVTMGNPKVLTLNRQQGKVIVGNRDGYITTEVTQTSATQTVEFLETGTQLTFRPFVMSDGFIRMELNPKDSDGGVEAKGSFILPSESTAEVTSNVLVKDGQTIVVGGLFREKTSLSRSQVPFLGNIPFIGELFRSTDDLARKEEVIFLITPHIVNDEEDYAAAEEVLADCSEWMLGAREGLQWHGRDRLAAAHYHWAMQHEAAGRLNRALWDARMAAYINPMFLDAIKLRNQLLGETVYQGEYGNMRTFIRDLVEKGR